MDIDYLLIDGSLDAEYVKMCGCCGPPPSPDYKVEIIKKGSGNNPDKLKDVIHIKKIVDIWLNKQMYEALQAAHMNVVLFYLEAVGDEDDQGRMVAKFI